jgi:hypothetical protein
MKKVLLIIVILLFLASVPLAVYLVKQRQEIRMKAAPASTLEFTPSSRTVSVGDSFTLEVVLETGENIVPAAELHITFNPAVFEATSLLAGPDLDNIYDGPIIDNGTGAAFIVVGDVQSPVNGVGTIASITFSVVGESGQTEKVDFSDETQAGAWYEEGINVLVGMTPALITVSQAEGPTATPTTATAPTATPTTGAGPTATPTTATAPTATPTTGAGPTSTPTTAAAPTATPTTGAGPTATLEPTSTPPTTGVSLPTLSMIWLGFLALFFGLFVFV